MKNNQKISDKSGNSEARIGRLLIHVIPVLLLSLITTWVGMSYGWIAAISTCIAILGLYLITCPYLSSVQQKFSAVQGFFAGKASVSILKKAGIIAIIFYIVKGTIVTLAAAGTALYFYLLNQ